MHLFQENHMKANRILFCCILFMLSASIIFSQTKTSSDVYKLGSRSVIIPTPEGFIDIIPRFDKVSQRFAITEAPENELLAVHVPKSFIPALEKGDNPDFNFYTKVSVAKGYRYFDATPADFKSLNDFYDKLSPSMLAPNSQFLKTTMANINKGLTDISGRNTNIELSEKPESLGYFDRRENTYSLMMLMTIKYTTAKSTPLLAATSMVRVNSRIIFVYTYRVLNAEGDITTLRDFTKNWVSAIIAANK